MGALDGRIALVTGASRGIGADVGRRLAMEGAAVAITARTTKPGQSPFEGTLQETADQIAALGGRAVPIAADLSRPEDRERLMQEMREQLGDPDILVSNAAVTFFREMATFPRKRFDLMFEVQVAAPVDLAQRVIPAMREKGAGWILNISSGVSRHPKGPPYTGNNAGRTVYGMCKAALERFTTGLAAELYDSNIAVNSLSPSGLVVTPGVRHHDLHKLYPESAQQPPEVMAEAALALCSEEPRRLTGRIAYSQPLLDELGRVPRALG